MADCTYRSGDPIYVDYTPAAGNIALGQVVLLGNTAGICCGIAHQPIVNNVLGTLAVGQGIYDCINLNNAANYAKVWWDNSTKKVTTVSTNNALFGFIVSGGVGGANTTCKVEHAPNV